MCDCILTIPDYKCNYIVVNLVDAISDIVIVTADPQIKIQIREMLPSLLKWEGNFFQTLMRKGRKIKTKNTKYRRLFLATMKYEFEKRLLHIYILKDQK